MAIEANYQELFSETVTLIPPSSVDKYGRRILDTSASITASAHLMAELRNVRSPDGRTVTETGKVLLYGSYSQVDDDWTLQLSDGKRPVILTVDTPHDQNGAHHTVISFGETRTA